MPTRRAALLLVVSVVFILFAFASCGSNSSSGGSGGNSNPAPTLSAISPTSATSGGPALTLTVTGANFIASSQIAWNGNPRSTSYVSASSLTTPITATDIASAGTASITVINPAPGGGTSSASNFTIDNPAPTLTAFSPTSVAASVVAFTLSVTGTNFNASSQIAWNGNTLSTTFVSATSLTTQITPADIASPGSASVTVVNPPPGGGTSSALSLPISAVTTNLTILNLQGNDLTWDSIRQKIYVSVPSVAGANPTTITVVDPIAGTISNSQTTSSEPSALSITDDGQFLYTILPSENSVARFMLPSLSLDIKYTIGTDSLSGKPYTPLGVMAMPGFPRTVAVPRSGVAGAGIAIYDDATVRPTIGPALSEYFTSFQWKPDATEIFVQANSSPTEFYTLAVNSSGTTLQQAYGGAFRQWSTHLHYDPQTAYVYTDSGEILNPATGLPVGNYPTGLQFYAGTLAALDPAQECIFLLTPQDATGQNNFQLLVYDETQLNLLRSFSIPNAVGTPQNFIRWGKSGLAFVTSGVQGVNNTPVGVLYILDGLFVNPSGSPDSSVGSPLNPLPTFFAVSPTKAPVGSATVAVTLSGADFLQSATASWNGTPISSSVISPTEIQAQIPASDLTTSSLAELTVTNPGPGGGTSTALPFSVNPAPPTGTQIALYSAGGDDLVWDPLQQKIYVSSPGIQGVLGNKIVTIDPVGETVSSTPFIGSDPAKLSLSASSQYLYAGMNGQNTVQRFTLPGLAPDINWNLGADPFDGPYFALDLAAAPGAPQTVSVNFGYFDLSPSSSLGIFIYDNATPRPVSAPGWSLGTHAYGSVVWGSDATAMYSAEQSFPTDFDVLSVTASGISLAHDYSEAVQYSGFNYDIHFDSGTGLVYVDGGQILDPSNGTTVGNFGASGIAVPDSTLNQVFFLGQTTAQANTSNFTIESFNQKTFIALNSLTISNVVGTPTAFIRWGTNGLAFTTRIGDPLSTTSIGPGLLYVISGEFVQPSSDVSPATSTPLKEHVHKTWGTHPAARTPISH